MKRTHIPVEVQAGINPIPDTTNLSAIQWVDGDKVRFVKNKASKIGGWESLLFNDFSLNTEIKGVPRMLFSVSKGTDRWLLIGTHEKLYTFYNGTLYNITPLKVATIAIANSLDTYFALLGNDPFTTTTGSDVIIVSHTGHNLYNDDVIKISGSSAVNGIPAIEINTTQKIYNADRTAGTYEIRSTTLATGSGVGGGASANEETAIITVNHTAHEYLEGDRVKIQSATSTGGIPSGEINAEHLIRNETANTYDIVLATIATSSVTAGGGASTTVQEEITDGSYDTVLGYGYGMGLYGVGLYGVGKTAYFASTKTTARLWIADRFGSNVVMTPGDQTGLYKWDLTTPLNVAPELITGGGVPTAINYVFVTDNFAVTLGYGEENVVTWSDQADLSVWTPAITNLAGEVTLGEAGRLLSHLKVGTINLLFDSNLIYIMQWKPGSSFVFKFDVLTRTAGIIGQNARAEFRNVGYWLGKNAFYLFNGNVQEIPNNTVKQYVLDRITDTQQDKIFCGVVKKYSEIWWFYPSKNSNNENGYNEIDSYVIYNTENGSWSIGSINRTSVEYPNQLEAYQYLIHEEGTLYQHEKGVDDDGSALPAFIETNYLQFDMNKRAEISEVRPDSIQEGDIEITVYTKEYPQATNEREVSFTINTDTQKANFRTSGRVRKYRISSDILNGDFQMGSWTERVRLLGDR